MAKLSAGSMRQYIGDHMKMVKMLSQLFNWRMKFWLHQQTEIISRADVIRIRLDGLVNDPNVRMLQAQSDIGGPAGIAAQEVCS